MHLVVLEKVVPGSILAMDIRLGPTTLLRKGYKLSDWEIRALGERGISALYIEDKLSEDCIPTETISERTRTLAVTTLEDAYRNFNALSKDRVRRVRHIAEVMVDEILERKDITVTIHDLRTYDDYTFRHSVNVTALSLTIGREIGLERSELQMLAMGGLFHDIGKMEISLDILNKKGPLDDEERKEVQNHPLRGFDLLSERTETEPLIWALARQHHESLDGSGYPDRRKAGDIHPWAKLITVADIWDALRSDRPYKKGWPADKVIELLKSLEMKGKLDRKTLRTFLSFVMPYPTGTEVLLSSGEKGLVLEQNREEPERPVVRIIETATGFQFTREEAPVLPLAEVRQLSIVRSIQ